MAWTNPGGVSRPDDPFADPLDAVLAEIAINIQLPPGLHAKAVGRYEAVRRYIERPGSPLEGRVTCFYPQGSMRIDATTSTRGTDDEYDLDIVAEIDGRDDGPEALLDDLEAALADYPVRKIVRQTRCVTLYYSDGMHLDITPARRTAPKEKQGVIAHAKKGAQSDEPRYVAMNAYAFGEWYTARTPVEERFAKALNQRLYEEAGLEFAADADVHDVPDQTPLIIKSVTTVALQLLKRHRNIIYANETGRLPPSVLLSCHAGHAAQPGMGLAEMVMRQARWTARAIDNAAQGGRLLSVPNPEYPAEYFTDRWPETQSQQVTYARRLHALANGLEAARKGNVQLEDLQIWLRLQFGERVVTRSVKAFNDRLGRQVKAGQQGYTRSGGLFTPAAPAIIGVATGLAPVAARAHTNMGERRFR
ncbi:MAG: nucleotidyltransferase [Phenylobacterium sp.]|uniref:nucleotidyltransferase domain-containing protein n=1 Tax=Phenylobacterium sp. TaxID=1871053 RepID=UPI0027335CD5|nr:nucleotidyltransferase [Phenylobacterium sp.]MDP3749571.1 nucleotidyltransferase [Phenylobacterium sp.]